MIMLTTPIIVTASVMQYFLKTLETIYAPKIDAKISTKPTKIWSKYTLIPNLPTLKRVPSKINSMIKLIRPVIIAIYLKERYLNRSKRLTQLFYQAKETFQSILATYSDSSSSFLLMLAMRLKDCLKCSNPFFRVNSGVSSTIEKVNIEMTLGISMKKPRVYFQQSIKYDKREMSATPTEKAS